MLAYRSSPPPPPFSLSPSPIRSIRRLSVFSFLKPVNKTDFRLYREVLATSARGKEKAKASQKKASAKKPAKKPPPRAIGVRSSSRNRTSRHAEDTEVCGWVGVCEVCVCVCVYFCVYIFLSPSLILCVGMWV